jgi:carbamoyltransferase
MADRINAQIKYRERWRPFCPSMLDTVARDVLQSEHPAPYMTVSFAVAPIGEREFRKSCTRMAPRGRRS